MKKAAFLNSTGTLFKKPQRWCHSILILTLTLSCNAVWSETPLLCKVSTIIPVEERISFHPTRLMYWQATLITKNTNLMLFDRDSRGNITPLLAKTWEIDKDKRSLKINLDTSCHWSDGHPVTAQDMKSGIQRLYQGDPNVISGRTSIAGSQQVLKGEAGVDALKVHALDQATLQIEYEGPAELLMLALSQPAFTPKPTHLKDFKHGKQLPEVGSGAYVSQQQNKQRILLRKNPYFCQIPQGNVDEIEILTDLPVRSDVGALTSGKVDILFHYPFRSLHTLKKRIKNQNIKINFKETKDEFRTYYLMINQRNEPLHDQRVKDAIKLAIDHDYMRSDAIFGSGIPMAESYSPEYNTYRGVKYFFDDSPYAERIEKAKVLMQEAGYSKENPLVIDLPSRKATAIGSAGEALAGMLKGIFIKPELRYIDSVPQYYANLGNGVYDLAFMSWGDTIPDPSNSLKAILNLISAPADEENTLKRQLIDSHKIQDTEQRYLTLRNIEESLVRIGNILPLYRSSRPWVFQSDIETKNLRKGVFRGISKTSCSNDAS